MAWVHRVLAFAAVAGGLAACASLDRAPPRDRVLIWADEFNGDALDRRCWNRVVEATPWDEEYLHAYVDSESTLQVRDGLLLIEAHDQPVTIEGVERPYSSAMITTDDIAAWTYGYYEARLRAPAQAGAFPAFWMMPRYNLFGYWPHSGEIDIYESLGREPSMLYTTIHYAGRNGEPARRGAGRDVGHDLSEDFHTYGFEWRPGVMRWYFDDRLVFQARNWISPPHRQARWHSPFDMPFYLLLNLAVGGQWALPPPEDAEFPMQLAVDYVRVYALPGVEGRSDIEPLQSACPPGGPG